MSELPENWEETSFGEVVRSVAINDKKLPRKQYATSGNFPVVDQGQEFIGGYSDDADRVVDEDLPLIIFGDHTRIFKFLNRPFVPGADGVKVLKPVGVDEKWLYHIAHVLEFPDKGYARHFQHLKKARLLVPPLPEQRRIVARIEELFSQLDAGVAALRHAKAQLKRYRQSILAAAVTGKLTGEWREQHPDVEPAEVLLERILERRREQWDGRGKYKEPVTTDPKSLDIPSTWKITNIDSVISGIEAGKNFKCEERPPTEGETGLVKISAVTWGKFDELESKTVTRDDQIREEHVIHSGDFLLSRANTLELVGAPVIVEQITRHLMLSDKVLRLRFIEHLEKFALFWLRSKLGRKEIESRSTGNQLSMRNIAQASLRAIPLPLPPLAEQHQIVAEVEARTTAIDHLEAELDRQITRSNRLRQSTLASAFTGKLTP